MAYTMTPARRAALRRAQEISAAKRRGKGKGKLASAHRAIDAKGPRGGKRRLAKGSRLRKYAKVGGAAAIGYGAYRYTGKAEIRGLTPIGDTHGAAVHASSKTGPHAIKHGRPVGKIRATSVTVRVGKRAFGIHHVTKHKRGF